jgi:hypothetical protein
MLRRRGAGTLLAFGDHSAALARMAMSLAAIVRSWVLGFRVTSKHTHCLGWRFRSRRHS